MAAGGLMTRQQRRAAGRAARDARRRVITYRRPSLYREQEEFLFTEARISIVEASTKTGKTTGCLVWLNEKACLEGFDGWNGWWVAPVYGQAKIAYNRLKRFATKGVVRFNDSELSATYPNGGKLWFKSAEKPDNLYGDDVHAAVLDEASRMREESWHAIRSTLTATRGPVRIIGNVKGRKNWYYKLARRAQAGEVGMYYAKLTAWHAVAAGVLAREEVEDAQRVLPDAVFRELYLAEPSEDGSNPFGLAAIRACLMPALSPLEPAAYGGDLAKSIDWTVLLGLDGAGRMARFDRWQAPWKETKARLRRQIGRVPALIDSTGVGDPIVEELQEGADNVEGFKFTATSKQQLMEGLALAIQQQEVGIWAGPGDVVLNELEAFEFVYTRTGVRYAAPEGMHDDTVVALALAVAHRRTATRTRARGGRVVTI